MNITCEKAALLGALFTVAKAVDPKPQAPVLSGIYLKAEGAVLELQATNYEIGLLARIDADIAQEGQIVIPGRYFQEVVRRLPGDSVTLLLDAAEMTVSITSSNANFKLRSMAASDYPTVKPIEGSLSFSIQSNALRSLIKKTVFSCSTDDARPVFTGCCFLIQGNKVTVAATNMHRLSVKEEVLNAELGAMKLIVPSRILGELLHTLPAELPTNVELTCSHNAISFAFDAFFMTSRLIEGQFPDYESVLPKGYASEAILDTRAFADAVDRVSLISRSSDYNIIRFTFAKGTLHIASDSPDIGRAEETIPADLTGEGLAIAFNARYISDVLKNIDGEKCFVGLGASPLAPVAIREIEDASFIYVATPVRTKN